jgi:hypothetical protein
MPLVTGCWHQYDERSNYGLFKIIVKKVQVFKKIAKKFFLNANIVSSNLKHIHFSILSGLVK